MKAKIIGDIAKDIAGFDRRLSVATKAGIVAGTTDTKNAVRRQVTSAGLGQRLANSWRIEVYPKGVPSKGAAGIVYSRAPHIISAYDNGVVIRAKKGKFLAIPTENAPKLGVAGDGKKRKVTPANFPVKRYGPLRFVPRRNGNALLVVDGLRGSYKKGTRDLRGFRKGNASQAAGGRTATVVMFVLIRQSRIRKRFTVEDAVKGVAARVPQMIDRKLSSVKG